MDFQDEEDADIQIPYDDGGDINVQRRKAEVNIGATLDFDYQPPGIEQEEYEEEREFKTKWGKAFHDHQRGEEEEEATTTLRLPSKGAPSEYPDDCPDCFGTGMEFPRLKGDCPVCKGKGKAAKAEEEEEDSKGGLNFTDDPEKVAKAKKLRDRAVKVRDKAREARDKAKEQRAEEKGENPERTEKSEGGEGDDEWDDDDLQGVLRTVPNSHLVYKRQQEDGTFDELWHYNIGDDFKKELKIRRAVLAGTDIPINKMKSPDGSQTYELWTVGNGQMLKVQGLPN